MSDTVLFWEDQVPRISGVQFPGEATMQNGGSVKVPLKLTPSSGI